MIPELVLIAIVVGWIFGGRLTRLADAPIKWTWLIAVCIGIYAVAFGVTQVPSIATKAGWFYRSTFVLERILFLVFVYANRRILGSQLVFLGMILNLVAILANGGVMPASPSAVGVAFGQEHLKREMARPHVQSSIKYGYKLAPLCDILPTRRPFLFVRGVYSVGDLFITAGMFLAIVVLMRRPLPREKLTTQNA